MSVSHASPHRWTRRQVVDVVTVCMNTRTAYLLCLVALLATTTLSLTACESVSFYRQSVAGHLSIMRKRELIEDVLKEPALAPQTRASLQIVQEARQFAESHLSLPGDSSFMHYVDTGKRHVVWNVFATEELSVEPQRWCFPVAGCVAYRGYFEEEAAQNYMSSLRDSGLDAFVGGVNAYSTLGWFRDPVLNTVMRYPPERLASLIFHELAHEQVYAKGDTVFNESFATAIEIEGLKRWLQVRGSAELIAKDEATRTRRSQFTALLLDARDQLSQLYQSDTDDDGKRRGKAAAFTQLKRDYETLKNDQWGGYGGYDGWFDRDLNNAHLVPVASYHGLLDGFQALLAAHVNANPTAPPQIHFESFFAAVKRLAKLPVPDRHHVILKMGEENQVPQSYLPKAAD